LAAYSEVRGRDLALTPSPETDHRIIVQNLLLAQSDHGQIPNSHQTRPLRLRIPRDGDQRSELMSITIPK
jgi:hypothetical protein